MSLLADDICRNCYHVHEVASICGAIAEDPGPDGPVYSVCGCTEYVDLDAESRIIVRMWQDAIDSPEMPGPGYDAQTRRVN